MGERCPHCGSDDYGPVNEGHEHACLSCGYDTEHGTAAVCPGGRHYNEGRKARGLCCDACYDRIPRDLPGHPRWRSERRSAIAKAKRIRLTFVTAQVRVVDEALLDWLRANPS